MTRQSLIRFLPLVLFVVIAAALFVGLSLKPRDIPSALIGKEVPGFSLPQLKDQMGLLSDEDLKQGEPVILNVWASWCGPCRVEHPQLMELQRRGVKLYGLNYKNLESDAKGFLDQLGDPYVKSGVDRTGWVGIEFGVYGVPETFVIDGEGRIAYKHIGPIYPHEIDEKIIPALEAAR